MRYVACFIAIAENMATSTKFTTKQVAVLQAHYKKGMVETGKADLHLVMSAAKKIKIELQASQG